MVLDNFQILKLDFISTKKFVFFANHRLSATGGVVYTAKSLVLIGVVHFAKSPAISQHDQLLEKGCHSSHLAQNELKLA